MDTNYCNHHADYCALLKQELIPAQGCTEPISIAYASACAARMLEVVPDKISIKACGNIIKNVKGVVVPNTNGLKGLDAAAAAGAIGGKPELFMEVLRDMTPAQIEICRGMIKREGFCETELLKTDAKLHFIVSVFKGSDSASVEIKHTHLNIVRKIKNGKTLMNVPCDRSEEGMINTDFMSLRGIYDFIAAVDLEQIRRPIEQQILYNRQICAEGLSRSYGLNVGRLMMKVFGDDWKTAACATAAAGSDARMSGCVLPVVINSGSGNQGLAASIPVIIYAQKMGCPDTELIRALAFSNLVAIYQKTMIGRLSAYCGAVSAACGSGAAIAYLNGASYDCICATIKNTLANVAGMVCDGAKPSCAAKIANSVEAAILGYSLAKEGKHVNAGEGLIKEDIDETIRNYGRLARDGMKETDRQILKMMIS